MRVYDRYLIGLGTALSLATVLMAVGKVKDITAYFAVLAILYLGLSILFVYLNPRARRALDATGFVVFAGIIFIVMLKVVEILRA